MEISNAVLEKEYKEEVLKAIYTVTLDNYLEIQNVKIVEVDSRFFVLLPQGRNRKGFFQEIISFTPPSIREKFDSDLISKFKAQIMLESMDV